MMSPRSLTVGASYCGRFWSAKPSARISCSKAALARAPGLPPGACDCGGQGGIGDCWARAVLAVPAAATNAPAKAKMRNRFIGEPLEYEYVGVGHGICPITYGGPPYSRRRDS